MTADEALARFKARHAPARAKRKSAKQQVKEARAELLAELLAAMRDKKRSIPKEWERGFMSCMNVVQMEVDK